MQKKYPKVLIIGWSFDYNSGGGITLSNLFSGWPLEKIAIAASCQQIENTDTEICQNFYQIGFDENKKLWPFNYLQKKLLSGPVKFLNKYRDNSEIQVENKTGSRNFLLTNLFIYVRNFGFSHFINRYTLSNKFLRWINVFKPDIIYTLSASLSLNRLLRELHNITNIPYLVHIMDDWPSSIASQGIFNKLYANKIIDREFRDLLKHANGHLSISEYMSDEYIKRYGIEFIPFQNCVDFDLLSQFTGKTNKKKDNFTILYAGRIGKGSSTSLLKLSEGIDKLLKEGINISFEIQTTNTNHPVARLLRKNKCVRFVPRIPYEKLPEKFSSVDLLTLPIDFDPDNLNFIRHSMPTKVPEYLSTGVPIFVLAPENTALSKFFKKNDLGFMLNNNSSNVIKETLKRIIESKTQKKIYACKALNYSRENYDCNVVRKKFKEEIIKAINKNYV